MKPSRKHGYIAGRNAVKEALVAGRVTHCYLSGREQGELAAMEREAQRRGVPVTWLSGRELQALVPQVRHQGAVAQTAPYAYAALEDVTAGALARSHSLLVLLDGVEDPHNVGAIIRTADAAGADAVLLPERRAAQITETVHRTSAGASAWMPIVRIKNVARTLAELKGQGYWVFGTDMDGTVSYTEADFRGHCVLVVGNEGKGMARLTRDACDYLVRIPMYGHVESLNVSVAAALLMYTAAGQVSHET